MTKTARVDRQDFKEWLVKRAPLTDRDLEKWHDFLADSKSGRRSKPSVLAGIFHLFKNVLGAGPIGAPAAPARPPAFSIDVLRKEADRFDRLAGHYGDLYRGAVIVNYLLGLCAVLFALAPAIIGIGIDSLWTLGFCVGEVLLLLFMLGLFLHGRSPHLESAGTASVGGGRWLNQRWHERWLEYRSLAERFRYASLLRLLRDEDATALHGSGDAEGDSWGLLYFDWLLEGVDWREHSPIDDAHNLLALIHGQQVYHHGNASRCERISRRLHRFIAGVFFISLLGTVLDLADLAVARTGPSSIWHMTLCDVPFVAWLSHACREGQHAAAHPWILFTAAMPALAAALFGIHSSCEFAKLARNSHGMARALDMLRSQAERLVDRDPAMAHSKRGLTRLIIRFLDLCTEEATGWHEMLWDKNVPLA